MNKKIAIWLLIGFLMGISYVSRKAWVHYENIENTIITGKKPIILKTECKINSSKQLLLNKIKKLCNNNIAYDTIRLEPIHNFNVSVDSIFFIKPIFINPSITKIQVGGFNGVSIPRITITIEIEENNRNSSVKGEYCIFYTGEIEITNWYWKKSLESPVKELNKYMTCNDSINIISAQTKVEEYKKAINKHSGKHQIIGGSSFLLNKKSNISGQLIIFLKKLFKITTAIFCIISLVVISLYLMQLKAGDIET